MAHAFRFRALLTGAFLFTLGRCQAQQSASVTIPIQVASGLVYMQGEVNRSGPLEVVLDTGASLSIVSPSVAKTAGLTSSQTTQAAGMGTGANETLHLFDESDLGWGSPTGQFHLPHQKGAILPIDYVSEEIGKRTDAIFGSNLFLHYTITVDYLQLRRQVLAAGGSCNIGLTFTPAATGSRSAALAIADTTPDSPVSVALAGTRVDFALAGSPSSVTVSSGQPASYSVTVSPQGGPFASSVSLSCSLPSTLTFSSCSFAPSSVTPGNNPGTATLTVSTNGPSARWRFPSVRMASINLPKLGPQLGADVSKTSALEIGQTTSMAPTIGLGL